MRKFKKIYIEITNVCNLSCSFCPETLRKPEFIKIDAFSKILDDIKPYGEYIYFHIKGEPLLHPELETLLDISFEKGVKVNLTTNGTLITKVKDILLNASSLRQINISLHSFDGNEKAVNKEEYINNVIEFSKEAREKKIITGLRLWNLNENNNTNLKLNKNKEILEIIEREFNLQYKIEDKISECRGIKISEYIYLNQDYEFNWPALTEDEDDGIGFCHGLRNQIGILVDGTVVPCCLDGNGIIDLGNINNSSFSEIIESSRAKDITEGFSNRRAVEELCRKCGYRKRFGR
ncbi:radical SAM protein [Clostridium intestinale]|uniref:radical SAM/SPASM domain-containing protein n=1 Tax=Clostridium intestinale TaxID=36845 RepID=UPI0028EDC411|nr:radical SAM protein [Clostridium intestinale]